MRHLKVTGVTRVLQAETENTAMNTAEAATGAAGAEATTTDAAMNAAGENAAAGDTTEEAAAAMRGRACARVYGPGNRVSSAGAGSKQTASRAQRKRRIQSDEPKEHIDQEKLDGLAKIATTEELHCVRRRDCQQRGVVPARSRDECVQEAAAPRGGDDMAD